MKSFVLLLAVLLAAAPAFAQFDFGDAPDSYGTLLGSNGARHTINLNIRLGPLIDAEADGAPGALALGDDATGLNDEDGVTFTNFPSQGATPWQTGAWTQVQVDVRLAGAVTSAMLDGWVDFNHNGVFNAGEQVFTNTGVRNGVQSLGIFTPAGVTPGASYARFRLSSAGVTSPTGLAADGEVEDYRIVFVAPSPATNVLAHASRGQVWVTWDFDVNAPAQAYEIYKSATLVANVAQAEFVARLYPQEYAGQNLVDELQHAFGGAAHANFVIPDATGAALQLPSGRGLCVDTVRASGSWYYAVVPRGTTTFTAANATLSAVGVTLNLADPPTLHAQQTGVVGGYQVTFLNMWCDGDDNAAAGLGAAFPLMANTARRATPHLCIVTSPVGGPPAPGPWPLNFLFSGGGGRAEAWLPGGDLFNNTGAGPTKGFAIALEDQTFQMIAGRPEGNNTNWVGYVPTFDPFDNMEGAFPPAYQMPPAGSVIQPYTVRRLSWTLGRLLAEPSLNLDATRVALTGYSAGGKGAFIWSRTEPNSFSRITILDAELANTLEGGTDLRMFGVPTRPVLNGLGSVTGDNFPVAGLTNFTGGQVRYDDLFQPHVSIAPVRDTAPFIYYYGLRGENWLLDTDHSVYSDVQTEMELADTAGSGTALFWDMREHGAELWSFAGNPGPCFTAGDFWITDASVQTKRDDIDTVVRFRSGRAYPAFYNVRSYAGHDSPGVADYLTPTTYYDGITPWPVDNPCWSRRPLVTGRSTNRGTLGGYFDWVNEAPGGDPRAPRDEAGQWAATTFLPTTTDGGGNTLAAVDAAPVAWLDCDIAVRRPQLFAPPAGTQVTWMECDQTSRLVWRSGLATVGADGVVRMPGIAVPRSPLAARVVAATQMDFGDAPVGYPVTLAENGARHATDAALVLGTQRNVESNGTHHPAALAAGENDNGVTAPVQFQKETVVTFQIQVSAACRLDAWVDWGADGRWEGNAADAYDRIATSLPLSAGMNSLSVFVPSFAAEGVTFARFRVSFGGGLGVTGPAPEGEVEDYPLLITAATLPTVPVLTYVDRPGLLDDDITWEGNPAYSSQIEHSIDLVTWKTFKLPQPETAGINIADLPPEFLVGEKHFFRLVRRALVTTPIPLPAPTTDGQPHSFTDQSFVHGGLARRYRLHLPHNWTPLRRWPLAVLCPGHSQSAEEFWDKRSRMRLGLGNGNDANGNPDGDPNDGWILCVAEATSADDSYQWLPYENPATYTPPVNNMPWIDDYGFVKALTDSLVGSGLNIDPARIYASGFSNGGSMCHYMAARPGHPFAAFAMIESGIQFLTFHPDPLTGFAVPQRIGAPLPRPVLMNTQVNSLGWPYEGRPIGDMNYQGGAPSPGVMANVARWTVANGFGGTADDANHIYAAPPFTTKVTPPWVTTNGQNMRTSYDDVRPDQGWPAALLTQPAWQADPTRVLLFSYAAMPRVPLALSQEYLHTIIPDPTAPTARVSTITGTWTVQRWRSAPGNPANEVVLVTFSDGGHNWPSADSPWDANAEVLKFFQAH